MQRVGHVWVGFTFKLKIADERNWKGVEGINWLWNMRDLMMKFDNDKFNWDHFGIVLI